VDIPGFLLTQITEGRVVLFLGAGASVEARHKDTGQPAPSTTQLARLLAERYLGGKYADAPLQQIGEFAISESGLSDVQDFIASLYAGLSPTDHHRTIAHFRWHGLATTNYDRLIEEGYASEPKRLQDLVAIIDDTDRIEDVLHNPKAVPLLKLHGCISRTHNPKVPLILSTDQYVQHRIGRERLFARLESWAYERAFLFVGYRLQDPDLRAVLLKLTELADARVRSYAVIPSFDAIEQRFWDSRKVSLIAGTMDSLFRDLESLIEPGTRVLAGLLPKNDALPIARRFARPESSVSERTRAFLTLDVEYVAAVEPREAVDPREFYRGFSEGWSAVVQGLDVRRKLVDSVLVDYVLKDKPNQRRPELLVIKGHAGAGKSIILRRLAWDASHDYNATCLFILPNGALDVPSLKEFLALCPDRIFLFLDNVADRPRDVARLLREIGTDGARLTLVVGERINEWNVSCAQILDSLVTAEHTVPYLDPAEIDGLLALLEKHGSLGTLDSLSPAERHEALAERAGRQLLVALHEATFGKPFEEIIADEYWQVVPPEAQEIYLTVCVLNRLGVDVRAGIVARLHGVPFDEFRRRFFAPLDHVVHTRFNALLRDNVYFARHPHIAEMVFRSVLRTQEERFGKYVRCLSALDLGYRSDERAFRQMVRGRVLIDLFPSHELAGQVLKQASAVAGDDDPYLLQQHALYEMTRPAGSLEKASTLLDAAARAAPKDPSIRHSAAELLLRMAEVARTPLEREQRLRESHRIADTLVGDRELSRYDLSYAFHTLAKIGLLRVSDIINTSPDHDSETVFGVRIERAIAEVEKVLAEGLQRYPGESYLLDAEARLASMIQDSERALKALQKAFDGNPRSGAIAARLAGAYVSKAEPAMAEQTLKKAIDANPGDRRLHFELAKLLISGAGPQPDEVEYHLRHSFIDGDSHHDARLLLGRQLYIRGKIDEAKVVFRGLAEAKVSPAVRQRVRYPLPGTSEGRVVRAEATYCFVQRDGSGDWVFLHRSDVMAIPWDQLTPGTRVRFRLGFTMRGPAAIEVQPA
jgi:tetratricopeptide (TPR) repeat protein